MYYTYVKLQSYLNLYSALISKPLYSTKLKKLKNLKKKL